MIIKIVKRIFNNSSLQKGDNEIKEQCEINISRKTIQQQLLSNAWSIYASIGIILLETMSGSNFTAATSALYCAQQIDKNQNLTSISNNRTTATMRDKVSIPYYSSNKIIVYNLIDAGNWGGPVLVIPSTVFMEAFGPESCFTVSMAIIGLLNFALPKAMMFDSGVTFAIIFLQGAIDGVVYATVSPIAKKIALKHCITLLINTIGAGFNIGTQLPFIYQGTSCYFNDWTSVFYVFGGLTLTILALFWITPFVMIKLKQRKLQSKPDGFQEIIANSIRKLSAIVESDTSIALPCEDNDISSGEQKISAIITEITKTPSVDNFDLLTCQKNVSVLSVIAKDDPRLHKKTVVAISSRRRSSIEIVKKSMHSLFKNKYFYFFCLSSFIQHMTRLYFFLFIPQYFVHHFDFELDKNRWYSLGPTLAAVVGSIVGGMLVDYIYRKKNANWAVKTCHTASTVFPATMLILLIVLPKYPALTLALQCCCYFFLNFMNGSLFRGAMLQFVDHYQVAIAFIVISGQTGFIVLPYVIGLISSWSISFAILSGGLLIAWLLFMPMRFSN